MIQPPLCWLNFLWTRLQLKSTRKKWKPPWLRSLLPEVAEVKAEAIAEDQPSSSSPDGAAAPVTIEKDEEPKETKKKKNRCFSCKKKLGLTGFSCRCGRLFCAVHRYSDKHECNFDYKAMGEKEISEANPLIVAAKVAKI